MGKKKYIFFAVLYSIFLLTCYLLGKYSKTKVLGFSTKTESTATATLIPTKVPTPTATPTEVPESPTPTPTKTPKPLPTATPASSQEINSFIERFSAQYSVDANIIRHIAICESGFNSNAVQGIYVGLFQFGPTTWKNIRKEFGEDTNPDLRFSAEESVQTASYVLSKGKGGIWPNCLP